MKIKQNSKRLIIKEKKVSWLEEKKNKKLKGKNINFYYFK